VSLLATFVLVHGASVGAWAWKHVSPALWREGHTVYTPTLTGLGHRSHLATRDIDLRSHIEDVVQLLDFEDLSDVILVGWSYGGMAITGAADRVPERIGQLVYLDADVPRDGEISSTSRERMKEREQYAHQSGDGWRAFGLPPEDIARYLRTYLPEDQVNWIIARLVPQPLACWTQPISLNSPELLNIPHTFIRCMDGFADDDPDVLRANRRIDTESCWSYREIQAEHFAPFTAPDLVIEILLDLAST
jgi:pimeloyl-ACP methyl ester carboxylesterase